MSILFLLNMPFRALAKMSGGAMSRSMAEDLLLIVNGRFLTGHGRLLRHAAENKKQNAAFSKALGIK